MTDRDLMERHIEHKIRRYQLQIEGLRYHMQMQQFILSTLREKEVIVPAHRNKKIQQLSFFGT